MTNLPGPFCKAGSRWAHKREKVAKGFQYNPFPFNLAYATSVLLKESYEADIKDCEALQWDLNEFYKYIEKFNPDYLVVETSTPSYYSDLEIIKNLKCKKIAVGAHATACSKQAIKDGYDYVIKGEYEFAISRIIRGDGPIIESPLIKDLDSLPHPPWDLMPMEAYNEPICIGKNVTLMTSRGCKFRCKFCLNPVYFGFPNFRTRKVSNVINEVNILIDKYNPDEVYFDDDAINLDESHLSKLCEEMKKIGKDWVCMGNVLIKPEMIKKMSESGCTAYKFGVESIDSEVLKNIPKPIKKEDVVRTVQACKKYGLRTHATYMIGLPFDTPEKTHKTVEFALNLKTDTLQFSIATPYPGTEFFKICERNKWLVTKNYSMYNASLNTPVSYPYFKKEEIEEAFIEANKAYKKKMLRRPTKVVQKAYGTYKRGGMRAVFSQIKHTYKTTFSN